MWVSYNRNYYNKNLIWLFMEKNIFFFFCFYSNMEFLECMIILYFLVEEGNM